MSDVRMEISRGLADELETLMKNVGALPICPGWMYSSIRHCNRNMDFDVDEGFNEPDRQAGASIAAIINNMPFVIAALRAHTMSGD